MKTQRLGNSDLVVSRLSYGNMRCVGTWNPPEATAERRAAGVKSHLAAFDAGYTLFDTADIYCRGVCEEVLGQTLRESPSLRKQIVIATKCGIRFGGDPNPTSPHRFDFSKQHILWSCEQSLKKMGIETIDLYQLHRPDALMNPPEIAEAFDELHRAGKVRYFGVSNFLPSTVNALQKHLRQTLIVNQVEIHPGRIACFEDGTLDQCIEKNITPLSWSPLAGGWLGAGRSLNLNDGQYAHRKNIQNILDEIANELGTSRTVVALAWLLKHPAGINPIVGSNNPANIAEAAKADALELSREQWYRLYVAARGKALP
ncbi:MAG: aldo/keto reductase [Tepidisphaeraceae bacterium]